MTKKGVSTPPRFSIGDHVSWNSEAGYVSGKITKIHNEDFTYKGHHRRASAEEPQYEIKSDKTDHIAAHKGSALRKLPDEKCIKYGEECPGYAKDLQFVQARTHRRVKDVASPGENQVARSDTVSSPVLSRSTDSIPEGPHSPQLYRLQALVSISSIISSDFRIIWSWFSELPSTLGRSPVLDSAIESFSVEMLGRTLENAEVRDRGRVCYVRALSKLQGALYHSIEWQSSETLADYEKLYAGTTSADAYLRHAKGIGALIEARGPFRERWCPFDIAVIQTFRSTLITASMLGGDYCSLVEERWRTFFRENPAAFLPREWHSFYEDYYDLLSQMPSIAQRGYDMLQALSSGSPPSPDEASILIRDTIPVYEGWWRWNKQLLTLFPAPVEVTSPRGDQLYPVVYLYDDVWRGSSHMLVAVCIIIANLVFKVTGYQRGGDGEVREMVDRICMSVETVSVGACGPMRVGAGLRIAYEAADSETRGWIKGWLQEFEERFAATAYGKYPTRTAAEIVPKEVDLGPGKS
ncbi:uncharacterized protein DNG_10131 [Cephalotrichum gorgonifer]|uniref:Hypervirulence associated protein TUDOR domain-containing protein n=1 Tax=Cephalotrichum gorgonifer TaxID=2041049 RepID=A0AAE8N910_9PEZI|nr:uncharacterized protein DNG_10131 [Cephalotrichum gorgonifer]